MNPRSNPVDTASRLANTDYPTQLNAGLMALERGQPLAAREAFMGLVKLDSRKAAGWIGLALASNACDDFETARQAIEQALQLEPSNLWALILKGDFLARAGDSPSAAAFYLNATKLAPPDEHLPPPLRSALERARGFLSRQRVTISEALQQGFAGNHGLPDRFHQSLEVLTGRRQIYHSNPKHFYYPGLPSIEFHGRENFPWLESLEAETSNIRNELLQLLKSHDHFRPYIESRSESPSKTQDGLLDNMNWSACYLIKNGEVQSAIASRCPATMAAVSKLPLSDLPSRAPSVLFSRLEPGAHIPPHCGLVNTRLIGHLPLVVPDGCEFRVGATTRQWKEGEAWVFDDSIEHEAWNHSAHTRVILLFEVWRPELSGAERNGIRQLFSTLDSVNGAPTKWDN